MIADVQDEELQDIYSDLERRYGAVTFEAWLALLVCHFAIGVIARRGLELTAPDRNHQR
jgi:hypothetical protein